MLLFVAGLVVSGCVARYTFDDHARHLRAQMREVVVNDGIDEREANVIAQSYFLRFGPGCGAVADVVEHGKFWVGRTAVGAVAIPTAEPIRIDKQSGRVTWRRGDPVISDLKELWE